MYLAKGRRLNKVAWRNEVIQMPHVFREFRLQLHIAAAVALADCAFNQSHGAAILGLAAFT